MWSPFFRPGNWTVIVLPAALFFTPSQELVRGCLGRDVLVYGEAHLLRASFRKGARDFLREPWDVDEMVLRAFRRDRTGCVWKIGGQDLSLVGTRLEGPHAGANLTDQQAQVLAFLVDRQGQTVSVTSLEHQLYPTGELPASRVLHTVVSQTRSALRRVLGSTSSVVIETVRGVGYRLP